MALSVFGSQPEFDTRPDFSRWWQSLPPDWRSAKGDARREWAKVMPRPDRAMEQRLTVAAGQYVQSRDYLAGFRTTPTRWIRGERWDDYVAPEQQPRERCQHQPQCPSPEWHLVRLDRGE